MGGVPWTGWNDKSDSQMGWVLDICNISDWQTGLVSCTAPTSDTDGAPRHKHNKSSQVTPATATVGRGWEMCSRSRHHCKVDQQPSPSPAETHFSWDKEKTYKPIRSEKNYCRETKEILGVLSSSFNKELRVPLPASHLQSSVPSLVIFSGIWRRPSSIVIVNVFAFK